MSRKVEYSNGNVSSHTAIELVETLPEEKKQAAAKDGGKKTNNQKTASLAQLFRTATWLDVLLMVLGSLASIVHGLGYPVLFLFFGAMTDNFVSYVPDTANTTTTNNLTNVFPMTSSVDPVTEFNKAMTESALFFVYIGIVMVFASYIQNSFWCMSCERQIYRIRKQFFNAILRQEISWFDVHQSGELTTRLADDLERVREGIGDRFSFAIQYMSQFIGGFVIGFWKGWKLTFVMMSLTPVVAVCGSFVNKRLASFSKQEQDKYAQAGSVAEEVISCIRTVTSFNGQDQDIKRYENLLEQSKKLGIKKSWISGLGIGIFLLTMFSAFALAFWYGTEQVKLWIASGETDGISPGTVLTVFFGVLIGTLSIGNITPHITSVAGAKSAAVVILDIIDNKPAIDASSLDGQRVDTVSGSIELRDVTFSYPTRKDVTVLKKFNLKVTPGQMVAFVGSSGCGKSTVVNLIQRFYDPDEGCVFVDGIDVRTLHLESLRQKIGVVSQEPILFGLSIRENILLGKPNSTNEEIVHAAKQTHCHDFISKLPQGYDTLVGERGAQLSGGQKQRVAIARALIRDPKILLLDEATSALDTESELIVQQALDKAREGRTTIVIAHRLSTIQNADVIYVVQDGEIVESGKHGELMDKQGAYHQLVTLQMLAEQEEGDIDAEDSQVLNGITRTRTLSSSDIKPQEHISRKQSIRETKQDLGDKENLESETVPAVNFLTMLQENSTEWPLILTGCIAAAINGCTMPVFGIFMSQMIEVFQNGGADGVLWSMMFLALGGVLFLTHSIQSVCLGHSGEGITMRLRLKTFRAMLRQDISYFDDPKHSTGALTTRLATDASLVKNATGIRIATLVQCLFGVIAALAISFHYGWKLAFIVLVGIPLMALAGALKLRVVMGTHKKENEEQEKAGKIASETIENIRTVQSLTRETDFYNKYAQYLRSPYRTILRMTQIQAIVYGFSQGIVFFLYAGCFRFGAYLVSVGDIATPNVFKVFFVIVHTGVVIGQVTSFLPDYSKAAAGAGMIFKILDTIPLIDVFSNDGHYPSKISGTIEFKGIHFHYPTRPDVEVLKGINIRVEAGQTVALVGPSGCGKSTVVSLIQRFYDPQQGTIELDGTNIKDINLARLRNLISVVSQEPILFDCSIKDNITYGLDSAVSIDDVISAARASNIHEFISSLPQGYETEVGEKGTQLSGGQKQRVAIARALVRHPSILLLDEATSALDTESEKLVQTALDNAREGRTCIVIAHRLSTIQNADVIYVIEAGNVVESGNHQQLLYKQGVYARLVSGQQLAK